MAPNADSCLTKVTAGRADLGVDVEAVDQGLVLSTGDAEPTQAIVQETARTQAKSPARAMLTVAVAQLRSGHLLTVM